MSSLEPYLEWYRERPVLVTGGLGFIGSHLAETLVGIGARVTVVDSLVPEYGGNRFNVEGFKDKLDLSITDIRDRHAMAHLVLGKEVIFNLAGQVSHLDSMEDPETDLEINCRAQLGLMESLRATNRDASVVYASTRQVYGRPQYLPVDESHPVCPTDVNGINKHAGEQYHLLYSKVYGIPTVVLRLTNTFGPRQLMHHGRQGFIPVFIRTAMEGSTIKLFGGGAQRRDVNFVTDVVDAFLRSGAAAAKFSGATFNLAGDRSYSLKELADEIITAAGSGSTTTVEWPDDKKKIDIGDFEGSYELIKSSLGWKPTIPLTTALQQTVEFYRAHGDHYW